MLGPDKCRKIFLRYTIRPPTPPIKYEALRIISPQPRFKIKDQPTQKPSAQESCFFGISIKAGSLSDVLKLYFAIFLCFCVFTPNYHRVSHTYQTKLPSNYPEYLHRVFRTSRARVKAGPSVCIYFLRNWFGLGTAYCTKALSSLLRRVFFFPFLWRRPRFLASRRAAEVAHGYIRRRLDMENIQIAATGVFFMCAHIGKYCFPEIITTAVGLVFFQPPLSLRISSSRATRTRKSSKHFVTPDEPLSTFRQIISLGRDDVIPTSCACVGQAVLAGVVGLPGVTWYHR